VARARKSMGGGKAPTKVQIRYQDVDSLVPYDRNPRDNSEAVDAVAASIQQFGFIIPIVTNSDGVIAAGHTRLLAARQLGMEQVPVVVADYLTPDQLDAFRVIDNKTAELADWNTDLLAGEISALRDSGIDFTRFGWSQEEIDCFSDMIADDCLSAGAATQLNPRRTDEEADSRRAPARTRFVLGDIVFFVDQSAARAWLSDIRAEVDFEEAALTRHIKHLLGIDRYEESA